MIKEGIYDYTRKIKEIESGNLNVGIALDMIQEYTEKKENWSIVIKTLLIRTPKRFIDKGYIVGKLEVFQRGYKEGSEQLTLDYQGLVIYNALKAVIANKNY